MTTDTMTRDGEIPAIFNPTKRVRTPSVVVTGENGPFSGFTAIPQITHSDSVTSSQPDVESLTCISASGHGHGPETPLTGLNPLPPTSLEPIIPQTRTKYRKCKDSCCSELAHKVCSLKLMHRVIPCTFLRKSSPWVRNSKIDFFYGFYC
jgi:hypothetical protein